MISLLKRTTASWQRRFPMRWRGLTGSGRGFCERPQPDGQVLRPRSAQTGVDLFQRRGAGAEVLLVQRVERRLDGVEMGVQVFGFRIDVEQAGNDLALGGVLLQELVRAEAIMRIVVGRETAQRGLCAVAGD